MENKISLNGVWTLCGKIGDVDNTPAIFRKGDINITDAVVPGNIELDLFRAGLTPEPFFGTNSNCYRQYEAYEWCFEREFEVEDTNGKFELEFAGIDCFGTVWINGIKIGECHNAYIPAVFRFSGEILKPGRNTVSVHIDSAVNAFSKEPLIPMSVNLSPLGLEHTRVRKPAHAWGWDIAPRLSLGGIFRDVTLTRLPVVRIVDWAVVMCDCNEAEANVRVHCKFESDRNVLNNLIFSVEAVCGDSRWGAQQQPWSFQQYLKITIPQPKLWWPKHYGEQNLYDVVIAVKDTQGNVLDSRKFAYGIRSVRLERTPVATDLPTPDFQFYINDLPVRAWGVNHVPCDALHSRDKERMPEILKLAAESDLNVIRIWGGGIPEEDYFYEFCDREGIMVWHDFMYGCALYPTDEAFLEEARREAIAIVRARRHHACIVLWAGDNECDTAPFYVRNRFLDPGDNQLTRRILPEVCRLYTPGVPYLPSSPYLSPECLKKGLECGVEDPTVFAPEQHLWGSHEYYKSDFYKKNASFVSETGSFACPNASAVRRFISPENVWPWDNAEWYHHASNPFAPYKDYHYRVRLMQNANKDFFGENIPDNLEDFACASQIAQAEGNKYFVETARANRKMSGLTLWNLIDCWPHFSDAIVDYYFGKKLSYYYCQRQFKEFLLMVGEAADWHWPVIASNDSSRLKKGSYRIWQFEGEILSEGNFEIPPGTIVQLDRIACSCNKQTLLLIEWNFEDGSKGCNHQITGRPHYDYETFRSKWLPAIAALDNSFNPAQIGK